MTTSGIVVAVMMAAACGLGVTCEGSEPRKVAFVDTGNTGRSVMAEVLATGLIAASGAQVAVISRAIDLDPYDVTPEANAAALVRERGYDVASHRAAQLSSNDVRHSDLLLTMTAAHKARLVEAFPEARGKTFTLAEYATGTHVDVPDAWGKPMSAYHDVATQLDAFLPLALKKIALGRD